MEMERVPATAAHSTTAEEGGLERAITTRLLFFYVIGDVLGSGIYALVGIMAAQVGGAFWTSFAIGVAAAMLTGLAYAELITKYPLSGGVSNYVNRAFSNRFLTFLVTFAMVAASLSSTGALSLAFGGYFLELVQGVGVPQLLVAVVFVLVLALINFRGISESVKLNMAMSITELAGLAIVLIVGGLVLFSGNADLSRPFQFNQDGNPALLALTGSVLAFFAMSGFENAANVAEEVQNPSRVYPRALLSGMLAAGVLYLIISFVAAMVTPTDRLAGSEVALLEVVRTGLPAFPQWVFIIIACVAITNTCLVQLITQSRILFGMAREGIVPRIFARTHRSRRTPWVAIVFTAIISLLLIMLVGPEGVDTFASATVTFLLAIFALVCACGIILRRDPVAHQHYTAPTALLGIGVVVNVALLGYVVVDDLQRLLNGQRTLLESTTVVCGIMLAIGLVLYAVNNVAQRRLDVADARGELG